MSDLYSSPRPIFAQNEKICVLRIQNTALLPESASSDESFRAYGALPGVEILLCQDRVRPVIDELVIIESTRHHRCYPTLVRVHQVALPTLVS